MSYKVSRRIWLFKLNQPKTKELSWSRFYPFFDRGHFSVVAQLVERSAGDRRDASSSIPAGGVTEVGP